MFFQYNARCYILSFIRENICCLILEYGCSDLAVTGAQAAVSLVATAKFDRDRESEPWGDVIFQEGRTAGGV